MTKNNNETNLNGIYMLFCHQLISFVLLLNIAGIIKLQRGDWKYSKFLQNEVK